MSRRISVIGYPEPNIEKSDWSNLVHSCKPPVHNSVLRRLHTTKSRSDAPTQHAGQLTSVPRRVHALPIHVIADSGNEAIAAGPQHAREASSNIRRYLLQGVNAPQEAPG